MAELSFDAVRAPRLQVLVNGAAIDGAESASVELTAHRQAARWTAQVALTSAFPASFWSSLTTPCTVSVNVGFMSSGGSVTWQTFVVGDIDDVDIEFETSTVMLTGRDLSARLLDTKSSQAYPNQTSSEIATALAQRHNLTPNVVPTSTPVGQFYQLEHARLSHDNFSKFSNEWELLSYLAEHEDYALSVTGETLNFVPRAQTTDTTTITYDCSVYPAISVVSNLRLHRSLTLASDIKVIVRSWDTKKAAAHEVTATRSRSGTSSSATATAQTYVYTRPNLSPEAAQQYANAMLAQLSRNEKTMSFDCPGELSLSATSMLTLTGTGTDFDQSYYVDTVSRHISIDSGFHQSVTAKNHDPNSEVSEE